MILVKKEYRFSKSYPKISERMPAEMEILLKQYTKEIEKIYGNLLKSVILYGSYARGDCTTDSDVDIMILLDLDDLEIKQFRHELSSVTYDKVHFEKWMDAYPFYANVLKEGVELFHVA